MLLLSFFAGCTSGTSADPDCEQELVDRWPDADGDGYGAGDAEAVCPNTVGYATVGLDCDDEDSAVHPGVVEACNGLDDDCNGNTDDGLGNVKFYTDADGDGFGVQYPAQVSCKNPGDGWSRNTDDCDDTTPVVNPDQTEICNGGVDDDCNGVADDNDAGIDLGSVPSWYRDDDLDGYGDVDFVLERCLPLAGWVADPTDCDDRSAAISPGAPEIPGDAIDENCNLLEGCYDDLDEDGARTDDWVEVSDLLCDDPTHAPQGFPLDCDDTDPTLTVDVGWYVDLDGDGFGGGDAVVVQCTNPGGGLVPQSGPLDCDEDDPEHSPATVEVCDDLIDQNCDLRVDCDDPSCAETEGCLLSCADFALDPGQVTAQGSTVGMGNDSEGNCVSSSSPDVAIQWVVPADGQYTIDLQGSNYDTALYVRNGCVGNDIACNDDFFGLQSMVQFQATAGQVLIIVVDGFSAGSSGQFVMNIY